MNTYTAYQIMSDGTRTNRENLNDQDEMMDFANRSYGKYGQIELTNDQTGETRRFIDNGHRWERAA